MLVGPAAKPAKVASVLGGRLGEQAGVSVVVMGCGNPRSRILVPTCHYPAFVINQSIL